MLGASDYHVPHGHRGERPWGIDAHGCELKGEIGGGKGEP